MLIIKSPIVLQSISPLSTYTDLLGEKIKMNYCLIGMNITGEELLHMAVQSPDIYIGMENNGITNILPDKSHVYADNQLKLELINQLVNRIMLYHSVHFTYQDEVFVTSVLQKMGITDVNKFMSQVSRHMSRNELLAELVDKYFLYGRDAASVVDSVVHSVFHSDAESTADSDAASVIHDSGQRLGQVYENRFRSDWYLHNRIFKRLMTAECNNILYQYGNQVETGDTAVAGIRDVAWMEQADAIQLSQLRENMFHQTNSAFWQQYLGYEAEPLGKDELTKEKIIRRMAAAVLENMIQKMDYELQQYMNDKKDNNVPWRNYTSVFCQGISDVVERFRYFQGWKSMEADAIRFYGQNMRELIWDELRLSELLAFTATDDAKDNISSMTDYENVYADIQRNIVLSILENQNFQKQLSETMKIEAFSFERTKQQEIYYLEDKKEYISEARQFQEDYRILRQRYSESFFSSDEELSRQIQAVLTEDSFRELYRQGWERISAGMREQAGWDVILENAAIQEINSQEAVSPDMLNRMDTFDENDGMPEMQEADIRYYHDSYLDEILNQHAELLYRQDIPLMENVNFLERLNEHNVHMKQLLDNMAVKSGTGAQSNLIVHNDTNVQNSTSIQNDANVQNGRSIHNDINVQNSTIVHNDANAQNSTIVHSDTNAKNDTSVISEQVNAAQASHGERSSHSGRVVVDSVQARRNALRVLENPQEVLNEIYENAAAIKTDIPDEIEKFLSLTDEHSRIFYERLLGYRGNKDTETGNYDTGVINDISESQDLYFIGNYNSVGTDAPENKEVQGNARLLAELYKKESIKSDRELNKEISEEINKKISEDIDKGINKEVSKEVIKEAGKEAIKEVSKEVIKDSSEEYRQALRFQDSVYSLLHQIEKKEENILSAITVPADIHTVKSIITDHEKTRAITGVMTDYEKTQAISDADTDHEKKQEVNGVLTDHVKMQEISDVLTDHVRKQETNEVLTDHERMQEINDVLTDHVRKQEINKVLTDHVKTQAMSNAGTDHEEARIINEALTDRDKIQVISNAIADRMNDYDTTVSNAKVPAVPKMHFIHKTDASMYEEAAKEMIETLRYMEPSMQRFSAALDITDKNGGKHEIHSIGSATDTQMLQKKLQDMKRELIAQSEEHLTQLMNSSLKAQVHTISDKVYVELERRLKNEQRRRGY